MIVRTLYRQVDIWIDAALCCYGFRRPDVDNRLLKKCGIAALDLMRAHKPVEARTKIYDLVEKEYRTRNWAWAQLVKTK